MNVSLTPLRDISSAYLLPEEQLETQKAENKILRQKLQSKSEALVKRSGFLYSKNAFLL